MMHLYRGYIIDDDDDDDDDDGDGDGDGDGDDIFQNKLNYAPETLPPTDGQGEWLSLTAFLGHQGPYKWVSEWLSLTAFLGYQVPYKPCNHNLYIEIMPGKWWNLCVLVRLPRLHYTGSTVLT